MLSLKIAFAFISLVSFSSAAECPKIVTQNDFDVNKYAGFWYELYRTDSFFETGTRCNNATYTINCEGELGIWHQAVTSTGDYSSIRGTAKPKDASEPAALVVTLDNIPSTSAYNVIKTDYVGYALVYSCQNLPNNSQFSYIWILSRKKSLSGNIVHQLKEKLSDMGIDATNLEKTKQNCKRP